MIENNNLSLVSLSVKLCFQFDDRTVLEFQKWLESGFSSRQNTKVKKKYFAVWTECIGLKLQLYSIAHNQSHQCFWLRGIYGPAGQWQSLCLENLAKKTRETQLCAMEIPIVGKWTWRLNWRLTLLWFLISH